MISTEIKEMVDKDLLMCQRFYKFLLDLDMSSEDYAEFADILNDDFNLEYMTGLILGTYSRYSSVINDFPIAPDIMKLVDEEDEDKIHAILGLYFNSVYEKLSTFKKMGYQNMHSGGINIYNENHNNNENRNINTNISVSEVLTFQEAKQKIENMTTLSEEQIEEILARIDELESIIDSDERKSKKWNKVKDIIKWVADKGFDIAKLIIPIALNNMDQA